jgi:hypothetical protein
VRPVLLFLLSLAACNMAHGAGLRAPGTRAPRSEKAAEVIYEGGLTPSWHDYGWAPRQITSGGPARINFTHHAGWIIASPGLHGRFGALRFRMKSPETFGDFLEVHVDSTRQDLFPAVKVGPEHRADAADGWTEVRIPLSELDPERLAFDRLVFRARGSTGSEEVLLDSIVLLEDESGEQGSEGAAVIEQQGLMSVDCLARGQVIHDMIYGIAVRPSREKQDGYVWQLGTTARRWGGNPTSTYNWQLGNAWNTGNDWFFRNVMITEDPGYTYRKFLDDDLASGVKSALTLPLLGWVARDIGSFSFPVTVFGAQAQQDPYSPEAGNGLTKSGAPIDPGPPTQTSIAAPPEWVARWVKKIREDDRKAGIRSVDMYILDNEPSLWNSTHRDVHPGAVSYDELLKRTIDYGTRIREADPNAVIAGPAEWGWPAYFYSAVDALTKYKLNPDRLAHGNTPLLPWYLKKVREYEKRTGIRILDLVDVHYYPMADRVGGTNGGIDAKTSALRLRATRSLWDSTYTDESWIDDNIRLIPRLKGWIEQNAPGLGITIGEWNFGAEDHISGGLAVAEVLGRLGQNGVAGAFYWTYPPKDSPAYWAFRAYRNFDGQGAHFLNLSAPTRGAEGASLFASRDEAGTHLVLIALNLRPDVALRTQVDLKTCGRVVGERVFTYGASSAAIAERPAQASGRAEVSWLLDPYSITIFDLKMARPGEALQPKPAR